MILDHEVFVTAEPTAVFDLLNDVARVASCLPGAVLDGRDGDAYQGRVKVKVGPITAAYAGTATFVDVLPEEHRLRLRARGVDSFGSGDAEAEVTIAVIADPTGTGSLLQITTDLVIRGKLAQFGKGAIVAISNKLLGQFADNLRAELTSPSEAETRSTGDLPPQPAATTSRTGSVATSSEPAALDGFAMLFPPGSARYAAFAAGGALLFFQGWLLGRVRSQDKLIRALCHD